jgi:formate dehydrogenase subunit gamma
MVTEAAPDEAEQRVRAIAQAHRLDRGPLLPILHDVQAQLGRIDAAAVAVISDELNLSRADVYGVVTFYHDFKQRPTGQATVQICRAEACQARGSDALVEHAKQRLGVGLGETTPDGTVTLDQVFCLGNCALGPNVLVRNGTPADAKLYGRVDAARFDDIVDRLGNGRVWGIFA